MQIELEEKQKEVTSLETRLSQLQRKRPESLPDNLPRYNHVFVGRKQEIARCLEALSPEERGWGVAIDGIGGMGKTALALEVAHLARKQALFDAYLFVSAKTTWLSAEGVREETLALSSLDSFCREFAKGLGQTDIVKMTDATERRRALLDALRGRRTLLIWDNLETLNAEERDMIAEFVRKLPTPNKAIITSRRRTGESAVTIRLDRLLEAEAERLYQDVLAIDRELGNETDVAIDFSNLGGIALSQGQYDRAESYYKEALAIAEKLDLKQEQAYISGNLGLLALDRDRPSEARPWYERELALAQELGRQDLVADANEGLAQVLEKKERYTEALPLAQDALEIRERLRDQHLDFSRRLVERLRRKAGME